jgi:hypothetical protein
MGFGGPGGMMGSSLGLLGIREVQKELGIDDDQQKEIKELSAEQQKRMRTAFQGVDFRGMQDMSPEERDKLFAEIGKKTQAVAKDINAKLDKILKKEQSERLAQLRLQREGLMAFYRPEVREELGLTEAQWAKMQKIREDARPQGGFPGMDASEEERREFFTKMQQQREKADADVLGVLTAAQKEKWAEMKGKEFKFPQPKFGPGGPGKPGGFGLGGKKPVEKRRPEPAKEE